MNMCSELSGAQYASVGKKEKKRRKKNGIFTSMIYRLSGLNREGLPTAENDHDIILGTYCDARWRLAAAPLFRLIPCGHPVLFVVILHVFFF